MPDRLSIAELDAFARDYLTASGADAKNAAALAELVAKSERDGPKSHGLAMLPRYRQSFESGYANPAASPQITQIAPSVLRGDGDNGYYQLASAEARAPLIALAQETGLAGFTCANCHHLAALRFDTEALAEAGLIAICVVNSLALIVPHGGQKPVFGTNPMSFACPRPGRAPIVWDQSSSVVALMDIKLAAQRGEKLEAPGGLDASGRPTTDAAAINDTLSLLPFAAHKGTGIALMVEILGAALAGGRLSTQTEEKDGFGALNVKPGVTMIALDPARWGHDGFAEAVAQIVEAIEAEPGARVPGDGRLAKRATAEAGGIPVDDALLKSLGYSAKSAKTG
ncbi:MAG: Ldh family oxidoreductase [Pseudomonadota bacterium]